MSDSNKMAFVGLDVHKDSIVVAVAETGLTALQLKLPQTPQLAAHVQPNLFYGSAPAALRGVQFCSSF